MAGFGEKLRGEREARGRSLEQLSAATGIHQSYLEALEKEEFHALPGRAFGKFYIRAYAEALGFDPRPLIEQYERERSAAPGGRPASPREEPSGPRRAQAAVDLWRRAMMGERQRVRARASHQSSEAVDGAEPLAAVASMAGPPPAQPPDAEPPGAEWLPRSPNGEELQDELPAGAEPPPTELVPHALPGTSLPYDVLPDHELLEEPPWEDGPGPSFPKATRSGWMRAAVAAVVFVGLFGAAATAYFTFLRRPIEASSLADPTPAAPPAVPDPPPPTVREGDEVARPATEDPPASARRARPPAPRASPAEPSSLSIPESGVGRRVAQRRLIEPAGSFPEGSVVWFSTRVIGGSPGEGIRHVWIREGRTMQSIALRIGGPDWRTHSRKTIYGAGRWAVEARDDAGRVLARADFTCEP